jgi:hypothetical protein
MKVYSFLIITAFLLTISSVVIVGCKYDVAEPQWYKPAPLTAGVTITSVNPALEAVPGVNTITIQGSGFDGAVYPMVVHNASTNKDTTIVYNGVYFGKLPADIVTISSTSITMRRPNLATDSCTIKVIPFTTLVGAKIGPYKIDPILSKSSNFLDNFAISAITIDNLGNLYVFKGVSAPYNIFKVTPAGDKALFDTCIYGPSDAKIGPDGNLYILNSSSFSKRINMKVNLNGPAPHVIKDSLWFICSKGVSYGDFGPNGYLYAGGTKGIVVIRPNRTQREESYYTADAILGMRVFNNYLYVAIKTAIYRHSISDTSKIGAQELVLDLTQGIFASRSMKTLAFSFSADGSKMYIGTYSIDPILIVTDPQNLPITPDRVDILYKNILPSYCQQFCLANMLYMIVGNPAAVPPVNWELYQVDVGTPGAPYY